MAKLFFYLVVQQELTNVANPTANSNLPITDAVTRY